MKSSNQKAIDDFEYKQAIHYHNNGELNEAEKLYRRLIKRLPNNVGLFTRLGTLLFEKGMFHEGIRFVKKSIKLDPYQLAATINLGNACQEINDYEQALFFYEKAIQLNSGFSQAYFNKAVALQNLLRFDDAILIFDQVIALEPSYVEAYFRKAVCLQALHRYIDAKLAYEVTVLLNPSHAIAFYNLGIILKELQQYSESITAYQNAIKIFPGFVEAYSNLGILYRELQQFDEAISNYNQAISLQPRFTEAYVNRGIALSEQNKFDEAIISYEKALDINPQYPEALFNLANAYRDLDDADIAIEFYQKAIEIKKDYAEAYFNCGFVLLKKEIYEQAISYFKKGLCHNSNLWGPCCGIAQCYKSLNQYDVALDFLEKLIESNEQCSQFHNEYALLLQELNRREEALVSFDKAIQIEPGNIEAQWNKSLLLISNGDFKNGWKLYEKRWDLPSFPSEKREFPFPKWNPYMPKDVNVLMHTEQGIGDEVLFVSILPEYINLYPNVTLECSERLVNLLQRSFPQIKVVLYHSACLDDNSAFDAYMQTGSLPLYFRESVDDFYQKQPERYLIPDPVEKQKWRLWLNTLPARINIGLCWRSSYTNSSRSRYYTGLEDWEWLINDPRFNVINLQYDDISSDLTELSDSSLITFYDPPEIDQMQELDRVCSLISELDFVITSGTAVSRFSSALGVKTLTYGLDVNPYIFGNAQQPFVSEPWYRNTLYFPYSSAEPASVVCARIQKLIDEDYFLV